MLTNSPLFAGIAVDDVSRAKEFCGETLGVFSVTQQSEHLLDLNGVNGYRVLLYARPGHVPPAHTVLNFPVDNIEDTVDALTARGVRFERYDDGPIKTDAKGIATPGPRQAWFKDPAGNILSILQA
jgi:predicted enzyme related to lactoylglutathione lyase